MRVDELALLCALLTEEPTRTGGLAGAEDKRAGGRQERVTALRVRMGRTRIADCWRAALLPPRAGHAR